MTGLGQGAAQAFPSVFLGFFGSCSALQQRSFQRALETLIPGYMVSLRTAICRAFLSGGHSELPRVGILRQEVGRINRVLRL